MGSITDPSKSNFSDSVSELIFICLWSWLVWHGAGAIFIFVSRAFDIHDCRSPVLSCRNAYSSSDPGVVAVRATCMWSDSAGLQRVYCLHGRIDRRSELWPVGGPICSLLSTRAGYCLQRADYQCVYVQLRVLSRILLYKQCNASSGVASVPAQPVASSIPPKAEPHQLQPDQ